MPWALGPLAVGHLQVLAFVERARSGGVGVELSVAPGMVHVFPLFAAFSPPGGEPRQAFARAAKFMDRVLAAPSGGAPGPQAWPQKQQRGGAGAVV